MDLLFRRISLCKKFAFLPPNFDIGNGYNKEQRSIKSMKTNKYSVRIYCGVATCQTILDLLTCIKCNQPRMQLLHKILDR